MSDSSRWLSVGASQHTLLFCLCLCFVCTRHATAPQHPTLHQHTAEVLRQQAIAGGAGGSRIPLKRLSAAAAAADADGTSLTAAGGSSKGGTKAGTGPAKFGGVKGAVGHEGEDVVSGWTGDGPLKLMLPPRFGDTTWYAAAWKVLSEVGVDGLGVAEVRSGVEWRGVCVTGDGGWVGLE